jgi:hypothetical protein
MYSLKIECISLLSEEAIDLIAFSQSMALRDV